MKSPFGRSEARDDKDMYELLIIELRKDGLGKGDDM